MTAIGFVIMYIGFFAPINFYIADQFSEKASPWVFLFFLAGEIPFIAGIATWLWRVMP